MFFLLTGKAPIEGQSKSHVIEKLKLALTDLRALDSLVASEQLKSVCRDCLATSPNERIQSASDLKIRLGELVNNRTWKARSVASLILGCALVFCLLFAINKLFLSGSTHGNRLGQGQFVSESAGQPKGAKPLLLHEAGEIIDFLNGAASETPFQNNFEVSVSVDQLQDGISPDLNAAFAVDSNCRFDDANILSLDCSYSYLLKLTAKRECYASMFSIEYESDISDGLSAVIAISNKALPANVTTDVYKLGDMSLTPTGKREYLWVVMTSNPIEDVDGIASYISNNLNVLNDQILPGSGKHRGIKGEENFDLLSEVFFPYVVSDGHTTGLSTNTVSRTKTSPTFGEPPKPPLQQTQSKNERTAISQPAKRADTVRSLLSESRFEDARKLLESMLESEDSFASKDEKLLFHRFIYQTLARLSEANGDFDHALSHWKSAETANRESRLSDSKAPVVFAAFCRQQMGLSVDEKTALSRAHQNLLIGEFTNDLSSLEKAFISYREILGHDHLLCKIAYLNYYRTFGGQTPNFGIGIDAYEMENLFECFTSELGKSDLNTLDAKLMLALQQFASRGAQHVISETESLDSDFAVYAQIDAGRLISFHAYNLFFYSRVFYLDEGKRSIAAIEKWLPQVFPYCPAYDFAYRMRNSRFLYKVVQDKQGTIKNLQLAHAIYRNNKTILLDTQTPDVLELKASRRGSMKLCG